MKSIACKLAYLLFIMFLINSCTYKSNKKNFLEIDISKYNQIFLNVKSLKINKLYDVSEKKYALESESSISKYIIAWATNKFISKGDIYDGVIEISELDVKLLEKKINSGYKRIFSESEEKYNLYVKLNLIFKDKVNDEIRTSVSGNIEFLINDKMSLIERKITVFMSLEKLIFQIDKTFNKILLRKKFNKYIKL